MSLTTFFDQDRMSIFITKMAIYFLNQIWRSYTFQDILREVSAFFLKVLMHFFPVIHCFSMGLVALISKGATKKP